MSTVLERLPSGSRVAVIRLRSLGDSVLTTPALALLKAGRPDLQVAIVVEDRFRAVFEENPDVDRILSPRVREIFSWRPRLTLNLHGGMRSIALTLASGAAIRAGFGHHRYRFIYSHRIPTAQEILHEERVVHTAEHLASAMFWLGVPRTEIPRARLRVERASARNGGFSLRQPLPGLKPRLQAKACSTEQNSYAVVHPFASDPAKTWPADRFVSVGKELVRGGLGPVFLAGPRDDARAFGGFAVRKNAPLAEVISLIAGAQLFIGNDSGPAHIAAAFGVPTVVLFGSSDPVIWAPWRTEARVLRHTAGIGAIEIAEVLDAVHSLQVAA